MTVSLTTSLRCKLLTEQRLLTVTAEGRAVMSDRAKVTF